MGNSDQVVPLVILANGAVAGRVDGDLLAVPVAVLAHQLAVLPDADEITVFVVGGLGNQPFRTLFPFDERTLGGVMVVARLHRKATRGGLALEGAVGIVFELGGAALGIGLGGKAITGILVAPGVAADVGYLGELGAVVVCGIGVGITYGSPCSILHQGQAVVGVVGKSEDPVAVVVKNME
ncbi:hypothetical protein AN478_08550 [Thiohalorhabdus denitrificans]|nr:hypothetical protein AN478_08550 [Thiohalorhabdus denitrificans]